MIARIALTVMVFAPALGAQNVSIIDVGYALPRLPRLAPGQVVTIFLTGLSPTRQGLASSIPLPTELAGIAVRLTQGSTSLPVPIFSVTSVDASTTGVTIQVPYELQPSDAFTSRRGALMLVVDGAAATRFEFIAAAGRLHFITDCDKGVFRFPETYQAVDPICPGIVIHGNGARVTETNPARPGEVLIAFAFGLGRTVPPAVTGSASPSGAVIQAPSLSFSFRTGEALAFPVAAAPLFSGLTPGFVGLYQINVRTPEQLPRDLVPCTPLVGNVQLALSGAAGVDTFTFCIQP